MLRVLSRHFTGMRTTLLRLCKPQMQWREKISDYLPDGSYRFVGLPWRKFSVIVAIVTGALALALALIPEALLAVVMISYDQMQHRKKDTRETFFGRALTKAGELVDKAMK